MSLSQDMDIGSESDPPIAEAAEINVSATATAATTCLNIGDFGDVDCSICLKLMIDPVETNCKHRSCRYCLFQWIIKRIPIKTCPMCRIELTKVSDLTQLKDFIEEFLVNGLEIGDKEERNEDKVERPNVFAFIQELDKGFGYVSADPFEVLLEPNPTRERISRIYTCHMLDGVIHTQYLQLLNQRS